MFCYNVHESLDFCLFYYFFIIFNINRYTYKQLIPLYFSVMIFYKFTIHVDLDLCTFLSWFIQRVVLLSNKYDRSNTDKIIKKNLIQMWTHWPHRKFIWHLSVYCTTYFDNCYFTRRYKQEKITSGTEGIFF